MPLNLAPPTPLAYFASLVASDDGLPLLEAAAALALMDEPGLDVQQVLADVDRLQARLARRVPPDAGALNRVRYLGRFFFGELGFAGNVNDYHLPGNSFVHTVLHTRRGIPISLAVLWLELARGIGLAADGIGFPGHFLVQARLVQGRVVIDPFTGQSLSRADLLARIDEFHPHDPHGPEADALLALHLQESPPRQMLARMLRNLQGIYRTRQDWARLVAVQDRLTVLLPQAWAEYRERGLALARLGQHERAAADLALYLRQMPHAADRDAMAARLAVLRAPGK